MSRHIIIRPSTQHLRQWGLTANHAWEECVVLSGNNGTRAAQRHALACALFAGAALAYGFVNHLMLVDIVRNLPGRSLLKSAVYIGWLGAAFLTFFGVVLFARRAPLLSVMLLVFISLTVNYAYVGISKSALTLDVIQWLPHEIGQLRNTGTEYWREIATAVALAGTAVAVFLLMRFLVRRTLWFRGLVRPRLHSHLLAVAAFLLFHGAGMVLQLPFSVAETNLFVFGAPALLATAPDVGPVAVSPARAPWVDKVVLVVDESVTYQAFAQLILPNLAKFPIIDYGEAASTANCSAASNALLRWGVQKSKVTLADYDPRTNAMIWSYAKAAGFRTVLIDGQSHGAMHNYVSPKEYALIDEFVPALADADTDKRIAVMINERLRRPGREFIYVVKRGAHFPYEMNYPPALAPAQGSPRNKYVAAVTYTTGGFFQQLRRDLPFSNMLLLYTSDHGQDFNQRAAHCNPNPTSDEYSVPLVAITAAPTLERALASPTLLHRASHLNIFATALFAFGYEPQWLLATYGPTLGGPAANYLTYANLGWRLRTSLGKRHTVQSTDFVESSAFPRRQPTDTLLAPRDRAGAASLSAQ